MTLIIAKKLADPRIFCNLVPIGEPRSDPETQKLHDEWVRHTIGTAAALESARHDIVGQYNIFCAGCISARARKGGEKDEATGPAGLDRHRHALWLLGMTAYSIWNAPARPGGERGIHNALEMVPAGNRIFADERTPKHVKLPVRWAHQRWGAV